MKLGTFRGALAAGIENFRDFPAAVSRLPATLKEHPVVMFCTGGIRCEKAGPFLEREGFKQVLQLDGGILNYFAECGGSPRGFAGHVLEMEGAAARSHPWPAANDLFDLDMDADELAWRNCPGLRREPSIDRSAESRAA